MTFNTWQDNWPSMVVPCVVSRFVVGLYILEMDVNYLRDANLLSPKHSTSKVWKFFGFRHEDGVITDQSHVSCGATIVSIVYCASSTLAVRYSLAHICTERDPLWGRTASIQSDTVEHHECTICILRYA